MEGKYYGQISEFVAETKESFRDNSRRTMRDYNLILNSLRSKKPNFIVHVDSLWHAEGEENVELIEQGDLEEMLARADSQFDTVNNRTDDQREYHVFIEAGNLRLEIPREFYEEYLRKQP